MNVGSGRDEEGSSSEEESDEEMVADAEEGEHVEPSAVAEDKPDRDQEDLHGSEEAPARNVRNPKDPLPEERDLLYKRGHLPCRAWCPVCVKARGREDQQKAKESDEQAVVKRLLFSWREMKLLVGREDKSKRVFCHLCKCKGLGDDRIVEKIMRSISDTGNTKIVLKTVGEPAMVQVQDRIISVRTQPTIQDFTMPRGWDTMTGAINEHIVVLKEGCPAIQVTTVRPKAEGERWSAIAIKDIVATPDMPNPKDDRQKDPRSKRNTRGLDFGASGGQLRPKQCVRRAWPEQELQNQQPHLGKVRPDDWDVKDARTK